jgi:hypothetical protein
MTCRPYITLLEIVEFVISWPVIVPKLLVKSLNIGRKMVKIMFLWV